MKYIIYLTFFVIFLVFSGCNFTGIVDSGNNTNANVSSYDPLKHSDETVIVKVSDTISIDNIDKIVDGTRIKTVTSFDGYTYVLYGISNHSVDKVMEKINSSYPGYVSCEKDHIYTMHDTVPTDPNYSMQYAAKIAGCEGAWDVTTGSGTVMVAVIDTGVNGYHEDLSSRVIAGYNFVSNYSFSSSYNSDDNGHGTHVAGIIGATGNNSKGIAGVAWQTLIMPVKVLNYEGKGDTSAIISGIIWAANNGAKVINMSLGGTDYSQAMADAVNYAVRMKNITVVVSMGNDGCGMINYPAAYPGVIAVGSTNGRDVISSFSTTGSHISVSAPGDNIYSLNYNNNSGYVYKSGTSMSSPFISGIAALLLANDSTLLPSEIKSILEDSAVDKGVPGFDNTYGYGRVDANTALHTAKHSNYGTIKVVINNNGIPYSSASVLLLNSAGTQTISSGTSSSGGNGVIAGECYFAYVKNGSYKVTASIGGASSSQDVTVSNGDVQTVILNFSLSTYSLSVNIPSEAGIIVLFPAGGNYIPNTNVTITAVSNSGFSFDHWEGNCTGSTNPATITMNGNKTVYAIYKLPDPIISPSGGTFTNSQNITITSSVSDAGIRYTTDGTTPTASIGTIYSGPITISGPSYVSIKAITYKTGWINSRSIGASYGFRTATPVFGPAGGTYAEPQQVTLSCDTDSAVIRYTTDYSTPSMTNGTTYSGPITVNGPSSVYIYAKAFKTGWDDSGLASTSYYFGMPEPTISPSENYYYDPQTVTISSTASSVSIRYTTDGTYPTTTKGSVYTGPFIISGPGTVCVYAIAYNSTYTSSINSKNYYFITSSPSFSPSGNYYIASQNVTISCTTPGATIRYTTDGSTPSSTVGTIYTGPVSLSGPGIYTIKAMAYLSGCSDSSVNSSTYYFQVQSPSFSQYGGSYTSPFDVSITTPTSGATIRYTMDGNTPTSSYGTIYTGPINITGTTNLKAIAYSTGLSDSSVSSTNYYYYVNSPNFSPTGGTYSSPQDVTISTTTSVAEIRYTTDGTTPTSSTGTIYTTPINISSNTTLKAIAYKTGWTNSSVISASYYFKIPTPVLSPSGGLFSSSQDVTISSTISGASIRYTTDGTTPTSSIGIIYTDPINISSNMTLKAVAYMSGWNNSDVKIGTYVFTTLLYDPFETGDFSKNAWSFGGNANPVIQNTVKYNGVYAAKFGSISHSQNSSFIISIQNTSTATVSFYYKISSESSCDYIKLIVDGTTVKSDSGEKDWTNYTYTLSPGTHNLTFQYSKDGSVNRGSDTAWVDDILIY